MSTDSLVLKIFENTETGREINRMYIFFDHNLCTFGIRGGHTTLNGRTNSYSFYTDRDDGVMSMVNGLCAKYVKLSVCLVNFHDLPAYSDNITYNLLLERDCRYNEMVGFDHTKTNGMNLEKNIVLEIQNYLKMMRNVYNDY